MICSFPILSEIGRNGTSKLCLEDPIDWTPFENSKYTPIPEGFPVKTKPREMPIAIHGFSSKQEIDEWIISTGIPSPILANVLMETAYGYVGPRKTYALLGPAWLANFVNDRSAHPIIRHWYRTTYKNNELPPVLYREIGVAHIDDFFEKGELLVSTFNRCRKLENDNRRDNLELSNIVELYEESNRRMEFRAQMEDDILLLCTSLQPIKGDKKGIIKINDVDGFFSAVSEALSSRTDCLITEAISGACVYNDKRISIHTDSLATRIQLILHGKITNVNLMDCLLELAETMRLQAENDIIMNKPTRFTSENEYRFVWKLQKPIEGDYLIVNVPEIKRFCERVE